MLIMVILKLNIIKKKYIIYLLYTFLYILHLVLIKKYIYLLQIISYFILIYHLIYSINTINMYYKIKLLYY